MGRPAQSPGAGAATPAALELDEPGLKHSMHDVETAKPSKHADHLSPEKTATLRRLQRLTHTMDSAFEVPVLGFRVGLDALIGLVPFAGDVVGAAVTTTVILEAQRYHLPRRLTIRMMVNGMIDMAVGTIPFLGDIFDVGFKANSRNLKLLQEHLEHPREAKRADCCFLSGVFLLFVVLPILLVGALIAGIVILILWLTGVLFH